MLKKTGIFLAIMLLLITIQSITYFFGALRASFIQWVFFNACAPSNILYLSGFVVYLVSGNRVILHSAVFPLFFFAITGLFIFPWDGFNIVPQICHFLMMLNIAWVLAVTLITKDYKPAAIGMALGLVFSIFIGFQQNYVVNHKHDLNRLMGVEIKE